MSNPRLKNTALKTTLNIGLENNALFGEHSITRSISRIIEKLLILGDVSAFRLVTGEWDGKPERTLVVEFSSIRMEWLSLELEIENLCDVFTQDAIAYVSEHADSEGLIYSFDAVDNGRDEFEFCSDYFLYI